MVSPAAGGTKAYLWDGGLLVYSHQQDSGNTPVNDCYFLGHQQLCFPTDPRDLWQKSARRQPISALSGGAEAQERRLSSSCFAMQQPGAPPVPLHSVPDQKRKPLDFRMRVLVKGPLAC